jgi:hypothetical protein
MALTKVRAGGVTLSDNFAFTGTVTGAANLVKIHEINVSSSVASVEFNSTYITDTYNNYIIYMDGVLMTSDNGQLRTSVSADNGSNLVTCRGSADHLLSGNANSDGAIGATDMHPLSAAVEDAADGDLNGSCTYYNLRSDTHHKSSHSEIAVKHSNPIYHIKYDGYGMHLTDSKINYIKIYGGSNLTSGNFTLYGIKA